MKELVKANHQVTRSLMSRDDAVKLFDEKGEKYKVEILEAIPSAERPVVLLTGRLYRPVPWPTTYLLPAILKHSN